MIQRFWPAEPVLQRQANAPRRFLDAPNALSLSRILLAAVIWIDPESRVLLIAAVILAGITDLLDGWLARRLGVTGGAGAWLDPFCDKVFVLSAVALIGPPVGLALLIATRELVQAPFALAYLASRRFREKVPFDFRASWTGKVATGAQIVAITAVLLKSPWIFELAVVAAACGLVAAAGYLWRGFSPWNTKQSQAERIAANAHQTET